MDDSELNAVVSNTSFRVVDEDVERKIIVAPWKNMEEFNMVSSWIYGEKATHESWKQACRQMTIWKIRRQHLTPAAVLGTLVILEVQLKDHDYGNSPSPEQLKDLQVFYSNAFTRFFNYMSSIMQSNVMKTMYETAKRLNLRSFVVDLRHLCAHGQSLPSIEVLRSTSSYCLKWLRDFYWKGQSECMQDVSMDDIRQKDKNEFEDRIIELFQFYDIALTCALNGETKISKKYVKGEMYQALTKYAADKKVSDPKALLPALTKDLGILVKKGRDLVNISAIFVDAFLGMKYFYKIGKQPLENLEKLENLIQHTQGLFRMLAMYGFLEDVFFGLLAIVENRNEENEHRRATGFWANQIVLGFYAYRQCKEIYKTERELNPDKDYDLTLLNYDNTSKKVLQFYKRAGIDIKTTLKFGDSLRRPWVWTFKRSFIDERMGFVDEYSIELLKNLLHLVDPPLSDTEIETLKELLDLNLRNQKSREYLMTDNTRQTDETNIYTPKDLLNNLCSDSSQTTMDFSSINVESDVKKYGIWSTAPECQDWSTCPIGILPWE